MRTFVAIELDDPFRRALADCLAALQKAKPPLRIRWVLAENQHLTLQFLGEIARADIAPIGAALQNAVKGIAPFDMTLAALGCFPNATRPNVLWVGVHEPSGALAQLQQSVGAQLAPLGYTPDKGAFKPHLTLARVPRDASPSERRALGEWFVKQPPPAPQPSRVTHMHLMLSDLQPAGARYTSLGTFALQT